MMEVTNSGYGATVKQVVTAVYHHWMTANPSNYPPNLHSRAEFRNGILYKQDNKQAIGVTLKDYIKYNTCDAKYVQLIWEFTPNGKALKQRMVLKLTVRTADATYWSFGSCNSCWKRGTVNFTDSKKTGHPLLVGVDNPTLPRLGRCGCVICNECVLQLELNRTNQNKMDVHCP